MEKKQTEIIITVVLIVVFFGLLFSTLSKRKAAKRTAARAETAGEIATEIKLTLPQQMISQLQDLQWGRDPFVKVAQKAIPRTGPYFDLSAVIWDEKEPHAVINDTIVRAGDQIGGYQIVAITEDGAVLEKAGKKIKVELYK